MKMVQTFLVCCLLFLSVSAGQISSVDSFKIHKGLKFQKTDEGHLTLDLYVPNNPDKPVPCIVVIQGGGFKPQDGQRFRFFAEYIAENGYSAALISYRGRPNVQYQTTMQDVRSAVRFVQKNCEVYSINPEKIGATGRSAGATLAALLAVSDGSQSTKIQAAVAYAGVFDFVARFTDSRQVLLQPKIEEKMKTNGEWIGSVFSKNDVDWKNASAINHVDKNDPPILFVHCKDDGTVPWIQSKEMHAKMIKSGVHSEILYFDKGGHGFNLGDDELVLGPMLDFFKKQFE